MKKYLQVLKRLCIEYCLNKGVRISKATTKNQIEGFLEKIKESQVKFDLVRVGNDCDGGYLLPNDFEGIKKCFSPGVSDKIYFESHLAEMGIESYLADYSVESFSDGNNSLFFLKKYIGILDNDIYLKMDTWIDEFSQNNEDLILQMDIEGAEYESIINISDKNLKKFRMMVIEFHRLDDLTDSRASKFITLALEKILNYFYIVHIHQNNALHPVNYKGVSIPPFLEITFLRKDRVLSPEHGIVVPHMLDRTNDPNKRDYQMPIGWYRKHEEK